METFSIRFLRIVLIQEDMYPLVTFSFHNVTLTVSLLYGIAMLLCYESFDGHSIACRIYFIMNCCIEVRWIWLEPTGVLYAPIQLLWIPVTPTSINNLVSVWFVPPWKHKVLTCLYIQSTLVPLLLKDQILTLRRQTLPSNNSSLSIWYFKQPLSCPW